MSAQETTKVPKGKRTSYPPEFKAEVIRLCEVGEKSISAVARELKLGTSTVHAWVSEARKQEQSEPGSALRADDYAELEALRKELRVVRKECDILRSAVSIFAKGVTS